MGQKERQIEGPMSAPDFAQVNPAPRDSGQTGRTGAKNTFDQAKSVAPDSGQTAGGSRQGGRKGSNSPSE